MADLIFGKYEIQHRLAIGGMGEVFFAVQKGVPGFERPVILKSLLPDLALQEGFVDQFLDEARVAATLNHPNVVSIYEVGLWNGTYYIAMEFIRGRNLSQMLRRSIELQLLIPAHVAGRIVHDAALGLDHAHHATDANGNSLNIVHRDISPQNIMVREDGVIKVVDFGIAHASNRAANRTATGALKGKLAYMAPEQIVGQTTNAADQFALGIVFWELLASRRLFKAESDILIARKVIDEPIAPPSSVVPDIPPAIDEIVMRMLARNVSKRFQSCAHVAEAIEQSLIGLTPTGGGSPVTAFIRRLGAEDTGSRARSSALPPAENFVISLKNTPHDEAAEAIDVQHMTVSGNFAPGTVVGGAAAALPPPLPPVIVGEVLGDSQAGQARALLKKRAALLSALAVLVMVVVSAVILIGRKSAPLPVKPQVEVATLERPDAALPPSVAMPVPVPVQAAPIEPEPKLATLRIDTVPTGASIRLDGRPLGVAPQTTEVISGALHYVQVEKPGFRRAEQEITALEAGETRSVAVKLIALERAPPAPPASTTAGFGYLTLDTKPWTKVNIDGDPFGLVPLSRKKLSTGRHTLELINEGENIRVTRVVEITSNKVTKLQLTLP